MDIKKIIEKITLPVAIVIAAIVLAVGFYTVQYNKQHSIERQQRVEIQIKKEQELRDYIAERKRDCLSIYETEGEKWGNVRGWSYEPKEYLGELLSDVCVVTYSNPNYNKELCERENAELVANAKDKGYEPLNYRALLKTCGETFIKEF